MKAIKLTKENAHLVLFRINQFLSNNEAVQHYSDWGKYPKALNKLGIKNNLELKHVEKTITGYILKSNYVIRISNGYGIVINVGSDSAIVIEFGDKAKVYSNQIIINGYDKFQKRFYT